MARYVPILRWKRGERVALQRLAQRTRANVVPSFILSDDQFRSRAETASRAKMTAAESFISELQASWGLRPFFLDASSLSVPASGRHPLLAIAQQARTVGCQIIPATKLGAGGSYQNAVDAVVSVDQRGVGLRVDLQEFTAASTWLTSWIRPPREIDLIADFADEVSTVSALGASIIHAFRSLHRGPSWKSVTVAGCSIPENFSGYPAGLHTIRRDEWDLWNALSTSITNYELDYGDYATVSPSAPPPGISWGYPINVKYTLISDFLICRGVKTTGPGAQDMDVQLRHHSTSISRYPNRNPITICWGDNKIDRIAAGTESPGNLEIWVQISVNRHIHVVRAQLP